MFAVDCQDIVANSSRPEFDSLGAISKLGQLCLLPSLVMFMPTDLICISFDLGELGIAHL